MTVPSASGSNQRRSGIGPSCGTGSSNSTLEFSRRTSGTFRHQTCLEIAPERNQQFACDCDDRNPPDTTFEFADTFAKPDTQGALRLMPQPQPRELNHHGA